MRSMFTAVLVLFASIGFAFAEEPTPRRAPNVILIMADDLGWGDVGYNGNSVIRTPHIDAMANEGLVLDRFHSASSICSPTRASVLTGRHPYRMGIWAASTAGLRVGETTIAEVLAENGYATGFFGKWHLGWVKPDDPIRYDGRGVYSPPWHHGFQHSFATYRALPTWNPTVTPFDFAGNKAGEPWEGDPLPYVRNGVTVSDNLSGDSSRIIMDEALPFIQKAAQDQNPFLATIWFHTPHSPVVAGPEYLALYQDLPSERQRHYYGAITAMDDQIGRLRAILDELDLTDNTVIFFTSDNGSARRKVDTGIASTGPFRGHKHEEYEGGTRVPSTVVWPSVIAPNQTSHDLLGTVDYFPTIVDLIDPETEFDPPVLIDGVSFVSLFDGVPLNSKNRELVTGYRRLFRGEDGIAFIAGDWKLLRDKYSGEWELYNLGTDPGETQNLMKQEKLRGEDLIQRLREWEQSVLRSAQGAEYEY